MTQEIDPNPGGVNDQINDQNVIGTIRESFSLLQTNIQILDNKVDMESLKRNQYQADIQVNQADLHRKLTKLTEIQTEFGNKQAELFEKIKEIMDRLPVNAIEPQIGNNLLV